MDSKRMILIDLGTNTAIFSLVEVSSDKLIISYEKSITTRIGQNIGRNNTISEEVLNRNIALIHNELKKLKTLYGTHIISGMTTEAIRNATNGAECIARLNSELGTDIDVITGEQEALYTWLAIKHLAKNKKNIAACDIGGGSTEIVSVKDKQVVLTKSFPIGVVRLEEQFHLTSDKKNLEPAKTKILNAFDFRIDKPDILFLSGGTATSTAAIMLGIKDYDPTLVEGTVINKKQIDELMERLFSLSAHELKELLRSDPGRFDVITGGVLMIRTLMEKTRPSKTIVTTYGPRHGYLLNKLNIKDIKGIVYKLK